VSGPAIPSNVFNALTPGPDTSPLSQLNFSDQLNFSAQLAAIVELCTLFHWVPLGYHSSHPSINVRKFKS